MDVLTAILACSLYSEERVVRAIVEATQSNPYAVVDPGGEIDPLTETPLRTLEQAEERAARIREAGGKPLLGLMQVPQAWAQAFGREQRDLFDPCVNISIGTAMLSMFDHECRPKGKARKSKESSHGSVPPRGCVIRRYAEAIESQEFAVLVELALLEQKKTGRTDSVWKAPILYEGEDRSWGADRVLFETGRKKR